ncbi:MAG: hydrogenase maturation protease [Candidatus Omnitrophota bacterium]
MDQVTSDILARLQSASREKNSTKLKVTIVGIGNPLRGDDGFGPLLIRGLAGTVRATLIDCGMNPENYLMPIQRTDPDVIILLDTVNFNGIPGEIRVYGMEDVSKASLSTHNISVHMIAEFLKARKKDIVIFMVGIQPKGISFGETISDEARSGIELLKNILADIMPPEKKD